MSYTPNKTWKNGDPVPTAVEMNHIEQGVQSINKSYTPKTWVKGEKLLHYDLNHIEDGIADAEENPNSIQVINGTLADPFGDVNKTTLWNSLYNDNADATIWIDDHLITGGFLYSFGDLPFGVIAGYYYFSFTLVADSVEESIAVQVTWDNNAILTCKALTNGTIIDLLSSASAVNTLLTIYWHPMPSTT